MTHDSPPNAFPFHGSESEVLSELAWLRENRPLARVVVLSGHEIWLATRYQDARRILGDPRFGVSSEAHPDSPRLNTVPFDADFPVLRQLDPPDHPRIRNVLAPAFTVRRIERIRPLVRQVADRLLDTMAETGPSADLVSGYADPLPAAVVCAWQKLPEQEVDRIRSWNAAVNGASSAEHIRAVRRQMLHYVFELIAVRRAAPGDDVISSLVAARDERGAVSERELAVLVFQLVFSAHVALSSLLASALSDLLRNPELCERLRSDHTLIPVAVEEMLRVHTVLKDGHLRVAREDVTLGGVTIRAGETVVVSVHSANRDATVFPAPHDGVGSAQSHEHLDLERAPNPHLTFGHGIHRCVAAHLNRVELQTGIAALLSRFPSLRLATAEEEQTWKALPRAYGLAALPVVW
ncbi:cytochrome P450 [Streptomyces natalensis]|uniref:Cytochrome P450 n=1 Tax=Streptomyces natalensis ATCC 27448 TaxID=1240678 RepID=A0A0D7CIX5_9ACTN|nr:cytochrome P450 [Streptomyces natalensis]KIZ16016.1 hypothetical protein SNA_22530 [Streptomyces natalensis ATCC 27448]